MLTTLGFQRDIAKVREIPYLFIFLATNIYFANLDLFFVSINCDSLNFSGKQKHKEQNELKNSQHNHPPRYFDFIHKTIPFPIFCKYKYIHRY